MTKYSPLAARNPGSSMKLCGPMWRMSSSFLPPFWKVRTRCGKGAWSTTRLLLPPLTGLSRLGY
jgi:hypothetical protein